MLKPKDVEEDSLEEKQAVLGWTARWCMQRSEGKGTRHEIVYLRCLARCNCCDEIVCMVVVIVDCRCTRCEDLLCQAEAEQNETVKVFNCDPAQDRMSTPLSKTKSEIS